MKVNMKKLLLSLVLVQGLVAAPIDEALISGDVKTIKIIFSHALMKAILDGDIKSVEALLTGCAIDVNTGIEEVPNLAPLSLAIMKNHLGIARMLIDAGANVNIKDDRGNTPLHKAARDGLIDSVKLLIENPLCDKTIVNSDGQTPEDIAVDLSHSDIVDMLHNAPSATQKALSAKNGLMLLAAKAANSTGVSTIKKHALPYEIRTLITNIVEKDADYDLREILKRETQKYALRAYEADRRKVGNSSIFLESARDHEQIYIDARKDLNMIFYCAPVSKNNDIKKLIRRWKSILDAIKHNQLVLNIDDGQPGPSGYKDK